VTALETLDATNWKDFLEAPRAVLLLGKSDCPACATWTAELESFLASDDRWGHVRFGKLLLDQRGLVEFKRANPWIAELDVLPHNVLLRGGERVAEFSGSGADRLTTRLERVFGQSGAAGR
jgi:hypothetical protein